MTERINPIGKAIELYHKLNKITADHEKTVKCIKLIVEEFNKNEKFENAEEYQDYWLDVKNCLKDIKPTKNGGLQIPSTMNWKEIKRP